MSRTFSAHGAPMESCRARSRPLDWVSPGDRGRARGRIREGGSFPACTRCSSPSSAPSGCCSPGPAPRSSRVCSTPTLAKPGRPCAPRGRADPVPSPWRRARCARWRARRAPVAIVTTRRIPRPSRPSPSGRSRAPPGLRPASPAAWTPARTGPATRRRTAAHPEHDSRPEAARLPHARTRFASCPRASAAVHPCPTTSAC